MKTEQKDQVQVEKRFLELADAEIRVASERAEGDGEAPVVEGYVAVFDRWSPVYESPWGPWRERIARTFFDDALGRDDVRAFFNHSPDYVLARTKSGTLELKADKKGLFMRAKVVESQTVRDLVIEPMRRGDIDGASFSFTLPDDPGVESWSKGKDGVLERTLLRIGRLIDVGPVALPFYPETALAARSLDLAGVLSPDLDAEQRRRVLELRLRISTTH